MQSLNIRSDPTIISRHTHLHKELQLPVIQEMDLTPPPLCHLWIKNNIYINDISRLSCFPQTAKGLLRKCLTSKKRSTKLTDITIDQYGSALLSSS